MKKIISKMTTQFIDAPLHTSTHKKDFQCSTFINILFSLSQHLINVMNVINRIPYVTGHLTKLDQVISLPQL
jgi:hypothetical protein